jgi:PAB-dependent poly(A)-specific ribonuclease subunit 3
MIPLPELPPPPTLLRQTGMTPALLVDRYSNPPSALSSTRFNVESPSFTPLQPQPNGLQQGRSSALSPRSANAAPFTPKSSKPSWSPPFVRAQKANFLGPLANHARPKPTAPEWTPQEFTEFVPKSFDPSQTSAQGETPFQPYETYNLQSTISSISPPQPSVTNPYFPDPSAGLASTAFYQPSGGFSQPVS